MEIFIGVFALTGLALALTFLLALFEDNWGLRIAVVLLARVEARRAWRAMYAETLERREREFGLESLREARS